MKKLSGLLLGTLMLGSANLFAQLPEEDSISNAKNKMHRDSSWASKNNMQKDTTWRFKSSINKSDTMPSGNSMHHDTTWRTNSSVNKGDTMPSAYSNQQNTKVNSSNQSISQSAESDKNAAEKRNNDKMAQMMNPDLTSWKEASKMAVDEITTKYGKPDGVTADELIWLKKGVWQKICVTKMESKHSFPIEHTDMMQTTINYDVPEDKMDDLGKFDGSVTFDRTQGTMSARCDKEGNNFLALNLANDIVTGKKTVLSARKAYGDIIKLKMKGGNPLYMVKLTFTPKANTADPDKNTTGLTKEDVTKAVTQNNNK